MKNVTLLILEKRKSYGERLAAFLGRQAYSPFNIQLYLEHPISDEKWKKADLVLITSSLMALYGEKVKEVFEDKNFPYESDICFGELKEITSKELESEYTNFGPIYGIDLSKLELDKSYDINEMGKKYGHIVFYAKDEDISIKKASEILLHIKKILDEKNVSFYAMDFSLQKPRSEDENINPNDKSIDIQEFLYSDIYEKGLENRIKENSQKLEKYYEEQDKIKDKQEQLIKEQEE